MRPTHLLIDEHLGWKLVRALRRYANPTRVKRVGEPWSPAFGVDDPDLLIWCEENKHIFVSKDRSTLPRHFGEHLMAGRTCWGIIVANIEKYKQCRENLEKVLQVMVDEDWIDRFEYFPRQD